MAFTEINWQPSDRQLRQFSGALLLVVPLLGWTFGLMTSWPSVAIIWSLGAIIAIVGLILPKLLRPLFLLISIVTLPIGLVVGELTMATVFFGLFLPIGLWFRLMGRDALDRDIDRTKESYWQSRKPARNLASYFRQF